MSTSDKPYPVPRQVTTRIEILPGFGMSELLAVAVGGITGFLLYKVSGLLRLPVQLQVVLAALPPSLAFVGVKGGESSLVSHITRARIWLSRPKRLFYRVGTGRNQGSSGMAQPSVWAPLAGLLPEPVASWFKGANKSMDPFGLPQTVQDWLPVLDVAGGFILRRDGAIVTAVEVSPINLGLKSPGEQKAILATVHEAINGLQVPAQILALPRPLDLDDYIRGLEQRLRDVDPPRQRLLRQYIHHVSSLVTGGDAQERRHYILLSHPADHGAKEQLYQAAQDLVARLRQADLDAHILDDRELLELLHVFSHPAQAIFERSPLGPPGITMLTRWEG